MTTRTPLCVLVTGANGFVGRALCDALLSTGCTVVPTVRHKSGLQGEVVVGDLGASTNWSNTLIGCDAVVHLAARVHMMREHVQDPLAAYREVNTAATLNLARQAAAAGVKRLIFISTIKVNGEGREEPYYEVDVTPPEDSYALSKWEAEQGLREIALATGLEIVILRPPLIYGLGVRANFLKMIKAIARGWPLPLGAVCNRRSLLYLGNFCDAIQLALVHPDAAGKTYLLSDGDDISTPELVRRIAQAMGRRPYLLPVPLFMLRLIGLLSGKSRQVERLLGSLVVNSSAIQRDLGWTPPFSMQEGLTKTVAWHPEPQKFHETSI